MQIETLKLDYSESRPHCEECGRIDPPTCDGYTCCCGEMVCDGEGFHSFEDEDGKTYCCMGLAERMEYVAKAKKNRET